jgi:hypothetical protein
MDFFRERYETSDNGLVLADRGRCWMVVLMTEAILNERHDKAIDFIMSFQKQRGKEEALRRLISFMVSYLSLVGSVLPEKARSALIVAQKYSLNLDRIDEAITARVDCWNYLKSTGQEYDFEGREARAIRAVLCALTTEPTDLGELTSWFLDFADGFEDHSSEIEALIVSHFK